MVVALAFGGLMIHLLFNRETERAGVGPRPWTQSPLGFASHAAVFQSPRMLVFPQ